MDPQQFAQLLATLRESQGFTFEQVSTIVGGVVALALAAWGIITWSQNRFDKAEADVKAARGEDGKETDRKIGALEASLKRMTEDLRTELASDRNITKQAIELLHSRQSNARKEFVEKEQNRIDLARIEQKSDRVVEALDRLEETVRAQLNSQSALATTLAATVQGLEKRVDGADRREEHVLRLVSTVAKTAGAG